MIFLVQFGIVNFSEYKSNSPCGRRNLPLYSEFRQSDLVRSNDDITDIIRWRVQLLWLKFAFTII